MSEEQQTLTNQQAVDLAVQHHNEGRLSRAKSIYQQILQSNPNQPIALHLLGVIAYQKGENDVAVDLITKALGITPDYAEAHSNLGLALQSLGKLDEAVESYQKALSLKPDFANAHNNLGTALKDLGKLKDALGTYHKALVVNPDFVKAHYNLGNALRDFGKREEAIASYRKALELKPDYAEAHYNLGNVLRDLGNWEEAIASYQKALGIKPDYVEAHNNLGVALQRLGKLAESVARHRKALGLKPNYAEAHNNLGNALKDLGKREEAIASYHKALEIKPDLAEGQYNLHTLFLDPDDLAPAIKCMKQAVDIDPSDTNYRFILGMLWDYSGDAQKAKPHFDMVQNGASLYRSKLDAWRYLKSASKKMPPIVGSSIEALEIGIDAAVNDGLVLEFGVMFGTSIRQIAALVEQKVHGFDSFDGLPEPWGKMPKGSYSTKGVVPTVPENVTLYDGWFKETLPGFVKKHPEPVRFMNIDCDIYSSTKTVLELLAKQIIPGTVIIFDEYIGNACWREDEFKAFQEAVFKYGWKYEYLCFSFATGQVGIRIN